MSPRGNDTGLVEVFHVKQFEIETSVIETDNPCDTIPLWPWHAPAPPSSKGLGARRKKQKCAISLQIRLICSQRGTSDALLVGFHYPCGAPCASLGGVASITILDRMLAREAE